MAVFDYLGAHIAGFKIRSTSRSAQPLHIVQAIRVGAEQDCYPRVLSDGPQVVHGLKSTLVKMNIR